MQAKYTQANEWFRKYVQMEKENTVLLLDAYNRIGDAYFQQRSFDRALQAYNQTISIGGTTAGVDYALYQKAFVLGLQGKYAEKIEQLGVLQTSFPKSAWVDDAMYETARSYKMLAQEANTIDGELYYVPDVDTRKYVNAVHRFGMLCVEKFQRRKIG